MATGFVATKVSIREERGVLATSLAAPSTEQDDFYLMLQRQDSYTEQDRRLGMDTPYLEYCGQGWSWYGHIERFELLRDRVSIQMDKEAASRMRNDGAIEVRFAFDHEQFLLLRNALDRTFRDVAYYHAGV